MSTAGEQVVLSHWRATTLAKRRVDKDTRSPTLGARRNNVSIFSGIITTKDEIARLARGLRIRLQLVRGRSTQRVTVLVVASALPAVITVASAWAQAVDDQFVAVAERIPEFGGAWVTDQEGGRVLHVWLTQPSAARAEAAQRALVEEFGSHFATGSVEPLRARYSLMDLKRWSDLAFAEVLTVPGAVFTDVDERRNRLLIALEDPSQHEWWVREKLKALDVPSRAVIIEQASPIDRVGEQSNGDSPWTAVAIACAALGAAAGLAIHRKRRRNLSGDVRR
ncbi:MAG TPA: hypothetical protein VFV35_01680 [Acidimicrobiales bacterium]|nr:hypothetical protein [Acidimicrobiales bacterium]